MKIVIQYYSLLLQKIGGTGTVGTIIEMADEAWRTP